MTVARCEQVDLRATPYYHCVTRCVRRAFLCGTDRESGRSFDHRKPWIVGRLKYMTSVFAIDLCAYAVMSNHYHVVVRVDPTRALQWSEEEVAGRWMRVFRGDSLVDRYLAGEILSPAERLHIRRTIEQWRNRLYDLSWFMRCINEPIARSANLEDECRGRFWEGRFKCQALLDDAALLACMAYVDLNPIRAGIAETLQDCDFASIQDRLNARTGTRRKHSDAAAGSPRAAHLLQFEDEHEMSPTSKLPFGCVDYLQLVEWTGRAVRHDKKGYIPAHVGSVLERLQIDKHHWVNTVCYFGRRFHRAIGGVERIRRHAARLGRTWLKGIAGSRRMYNLSPG